MLIHARSVMDALGLDAPVWESGVPSRAHRIYREILELDDPECWTTDQSDLADFTSVGEPVAPETVRLLDRIEQHCLVDVRTAQSNRIVDVRTVLLARAVSGLVRGRGAAEPGDW